MLIAFATLRGSPGATTVATLAADIAATKGPVVLADIDGDGSLLAHRYGETLAPWAVDPTRDPAGHGRTRTSGAVVLAGPMDGPSMAAAHPAVVPALRQLADSHLVLVDCGRIGGTAAAGFAAADRRHLLVRDLPEHREAANRLLAGHKGYAQVLVVGGTGQIPHDPQTAELVRTDDLPVDQMVGTALGKAVAAAVLTGATVPVRRAAEPGWAAATPVS